MRFNGNRGSTGTERGSMGTERGSVETVCW